MDVGLRIFTRCRQGIKMNTNINNMQHCVCPELNSNYFSIHKLNQPCHKEEQLSIGWTIISAQYILFPSPHLHSKSV